jgi:ribosomal protein L29
MKATRSASFLRAQIIEKLYVEVIELKKITKAYKFQNNIAQLTFA